MSARDSIEMRFSLSRDCTLIVVVTNPGSLETDDVQVVDEVFRLHAHTLKRVATSNEARETRWSAASLAPRERDP